MPRLRIAAAALIGFAAALLGAAAFPLAASQQADGPGRPLASGLFLDKATGLLAGRVAAGASVAATVEELARIAGTAVQLQPGLGTVPNALVLDGLTVEAALHRLLRYRSFVIFRSGPDDGPGEIAKIWIIVEGDPFEPERAPAPVAEAPAKAVDPDRADLEVTRAIARRDIIQLSNASDQASLERLRDLAQNAEDPALRRSALSALTGRAGEASYNLLVYSGLRDPDATVRIQAARSVLYLDEYRGAAVVRAAAARETDAATREILERLARGEAVEQVTGLSRTLLNR